MPKTKVKPNQFNMTVGCITGSLRGLLDFNLDKV